MGERKTDTAPLAEPCHDAAGDPEVAESFYGPHEWIAIWRKSEGTVDDFPDPDLAPRREMLEAHLETRSNPLQVVRQQILPEIPGCRDLGPGHTGALVSAHQHAAPLFAQIDLALEVDAMKLLFLTFQRGNLLRDQVLMLHSQNRQLEAHHSPDFARPQTARVHHMLGVH